MDWNTPDRQAACREPLHETDEDFDDDYAPCDGAENIDCAGIEDIPRDALAKLVLYLIPAKSKPGKRWRIAQLRLAIIAQAVDADGIGKLSFEDLSKELKCTRAILSYHALRMIDALGIEKLRNGKQRRTREMYRQTAIRSHIKRGHRMKQDAPQPAL